MGLLRFSAAWNVSKTAFEAYIDFENEQCLGKFPDIYCPFYHLDEIPDELKDLELVQFFFEFVEIIAVIDTHWAELVRTLSNSFYIGIALLIMPTRVILYTIHNYLTKRDYSYSIEDICDLSIGICIGIWIYSFYNESSKKVPYF